MYYARNRFTLSVAPVVVMHQTSVGPVMPHVLLQYVPVIYGILRRSTMRKAFVLQLIPISSDFLWFKIAFLLFYLFYNVQIGT